MNQEPDFTKNISSDTVCNFFYYFFIAYSVLGGLGLIGLIGTLTMVKMPMSVKLMSALKYIIMIGLAVVSALFHYLVCSRALLTGQPDKAAKPMQGYNYM